MTYPTPVPEQPGGLVPSWIRTNVPVLIGLLATYLASRWNIILDEQTKLGLVLFVGGVAVSIYYTVVRLLERKFPQIGWLLGLAKQPAYSPQPAPEPEPTVVAAVSDLPLEPEPATLAVDDEAADEIPEFDSGYRRSPADHRDWSYRQRVMGVISGAGKRLAARYQVDKRSPLTAYNQVGPSCVAWAMATLKTVQERLDKRRTILFNGQPFYERIALPGGGAYIRDALELARTVGVPDENGKLYKISGYAAIDPRDHQAVKHAISSGRGVLIGFMVTRSWADGGGDEFDQSGADEELGGHGMFVTGYEPAGPIGLNTWGPDWSEDGRALLPWAYWDQHVWECWTVVDVND